MASGREGESSCSSRQASTAARSSGCKRTWICVPLPVARGPRFFRIFTAWRFIESLVPQFRGRSNEPVRQGI